MPLGRVAQQENSSLPQELLDYQLYELNEPYPTACENNGDLRAQTQTHYTCTSPLANEGAPFRVQKSDYDYLSGFPVYFDCTEAPVTNNVCMCPKGNSDYLCATTDTQKCWVQITDPDFAKGCPEKGDSAYYLYSLNGYAPCYFLDFQSTYRVKFKVSCMLVDATDNSMQTY